MSKKNNCKDNSNKCSNFAKSGKCFKFKNVAEKLCKKSCGFCNPSVKDLIEVYQREKSIYHTFDPVLYKINNESNDREKNLNFNDIYGNSTKVHNYHIKKVKDDAYELDETLERDETDLDRENILKSNEESIWKDYLEFQEKNKLASGKVEDKYRKDKQSYMLSLNINKTWEKELEAILLKMRNNKLPYSKDKLLKSKKMNKKLTYNDIINVVDSIKKKIDDENKIYRQKTVSKLNVKDSKDNMVKSANLNEKKQKKKYVKKELPDNEELLDYLDKVKKDILEEKNIESMMELSDDPNYKLDKSLIKTEFNNIITIKERSYEIPRFMKYLTITTTILIIYGIILRLVTKKLV